ncbi:MAG: sugar phosphate isomerase/epimerase [Arachnia sp.]
MPRLSLQLYSVRQALAEDQGGTLARLAELGFVAVEGFDFVGRAAALRAALDAEGLRSPSAHASFISDQLEPGAARVELPAFELVLDEAAALGVEILIDPFVARPFWERPDDIARTAERLNALVDPAAERGIRLGYHNHSHEFHHSLGGVPALEVFAAQLDPRVVLEVDVFWAAIGRQDPVALLERLGDRVRLLHAKDGVIGADPHQPDASGVVLDQRPVGQGELDMAAILAAAPQTEYAVVEFDEVAGDIFEAIAASAAGLRVLGVAA